MDAPNTPTSDSSPSEENSAPEGKSSFEKWLVRFFLILAFGVAFGIEGMTLFRSYVLDRDTGADTEQVEQEPVLPVLGVGDEVLPATPPTERIEVLSVRAERGANWTFDMAVTVQNTTDRPYTLTVFGLLTKQGAVYENAFSVTCAPGDSAELTAQWTLDGGDQPKSIVASGRAAVTADSTVVEARRFRFQRIPVQMAQ